MGKFRQVGIPKLPGNLQDKRRNSVLIFSIVIHSFLINSPVTVDPYLYVYLFTFASQPFLLSITKTHLKQDLSPTPIGLHHLDTPITLKHTHTHSKHRQEYDGVHRTTLIYTGSLSTRSHTYSRLCEKPQHSHTVHTNKCLISAHTHTHTH